VLLKIGICIIDLPITKSGNQHVAVFPDILTKTLLVFPIPDQKTIHLVKLLIEKLYHFFGVLEFSAIRQRYQFALLFDERLSVILYIGG